MIKARYRILVAVIESAAMIASAVLHGIGITSPKDRSKMIDLIKFKERERTPLDPLDPPLIALVIMSKSQSKKC